MFKLHIECNRAVGFNPPAVLCSDWTVKSAIFTELSGNLSENGYNAPWASSTIKYVPYFSHVFLIARTSDTMPSYVGDVIIATSASSNSDFANYYSNKGLHVSPCSDFGLMMKAYENAKKNNIPVHVGPIFSSDIFYDPQKDFYKLPQELGILAVEMESYALFLNAMRLHKKALCLLTVSDSFVNDEKDLTQEERSHNLTRMVELALTLA